MKCDAFLERLDALIDDELPRGDAAACQEHFEECSPCRTAHEERRALKALVHERAARPSLPPGLEEHLRGTLGAQPRSRKVARFLQTAAALIIVGVAVGLFFLRVTPPLSHASAAAGCASAFERMLEASPMAAAGISGDWETEIRQALEKELGIEVRMLPRLRDAIFTHWEPQTIEGVRGYRVDFRAESPESNDGNAAAISLFLLPLVQVTLDPEERRMLASRHLCSCNPWPSGSVVCFSHEGILVSVVGKVSPQRLEHHLGSR